MSRNKRSGWYRFWNEPTKALRRGFSDGRGGFGHVPFPGMVGWCSKEGSPGEAYWRGYIAGQKARDNA